MIDDTTTRIGEEKDMVVFDSRLAWHFAPKSFFHFIKYFLCNLSRCCISALYYKIIVTHIIIRHFAPKSFKVFVITDIDEASRRVFHDSQRANSESYATQADCKKALIHRLPVFNVHTPPFSLTVIKSLPSVDSFAFSVIRIDDGFNSINF